MTRKNYLLTALAEEDLRAAKIWSQRRWGKELTRHYFSDLHKAAQHIAKTHASSGTRNELSGKTGLCLYPVREHYLVYMPISDNCIVIVTVLRQGRDIPAILNKGRYQIERELDRIMDKIARGEIKFKATSQKTSKPLQ